MLVGLQRQWKESEIAGIRTFPLITLLGTVAVLVDGGSAGWSTAAGLPALAALLIVANLAKLKDGQSDPGLTTEAAALLMYVVGAALAADFRAPAIAVAGVAAVLLHWKKRMHEFVRGFGEKDVRAVMHLVLIALVILPALPNETYGPYDVLNPYKIWLMVVLIVGISLAAYVAYKLLGPRVGAILGGVLGGLISSTATTVSYARQSKASADVSAIAAVVIMIASAIANIRVLAEIAVVAPGLLPFVVAPLVILTVVMLLLAGIMFLWKGKTPTSTPSHDNPTQLKAAIVFGAMYALVLFFVAAAKDLFGEQALYVVAVISGLTDLDAITLSTAKLFNDERVAAGAAWRIVLVAAMSNLVFKAAAVALLGSNRLKLLIAVLFGMSLAVGAAILLLWPDLQVSLPAMGGRSAI